MFPTEKPERSLKISLHTAANPELKMRRRRMMRRMMRRKMRRRRTMMMMRRMMMMMMKGTCCILSGVRLQTVSLPVMKITSCCFGGPDYSDLYVTSASLGLDQSERRQQPLAGDTFRVRLSQQLTCLQFIH